MTELMRKEFNATAEPLADRLYRFTISTGDEDLEHDRIDPNGWDLQSYRDNPTILWAHLHSIPAIGRSVEIGVVGGKLRAVAERPPRGIHPFADQVWDLVDARFLSRASVGFRPGRKTYDAARDGYNIYEATLQEWSVVNLPALPQARIDRGADGIDREAITKWLPAPTPAWSQLLTLPANLTAEKFAQLCARAINKGVPEVVEQLVRRYLAHRGGSDPHRIVLELADPPGHVHRAHTGNLVGPPRRYRPDEVVLETRDEEPRR